MLLARLPLLVSILLCLALAGAMYWQLMPFYQQVMLETKAVSANKYTQITAAPKAQNKKTQNIAAFQLFGNTNSKPKKAAPVAKNLPKTTLKLTLTGVLASTNKKQASALIQGPNKETINYKINDELPGGATLKDVFSDRVVIERSGRLENLVFIETRPIGIETHKDDIPETNQYNENTSSASGKVPSNRPTGQPINPARTQSIKERLSKLRSRMLKNRP